MKAKAPIMITISLYRGFAAALAQQDSQFYLWSNLLHLQYFLISTFVNSSLQAINGYTASLAGNCKLKFIRFILRPN
jgi:hypothetical protein